MKRIFSALAVILAVTPAIAKDAPPAPPSATHTGTVGLWLGNVWSTVPNAALSLADFQTFQKGNGFGGQWLLASFTANQLSFDSRYSNFTSTEGMPPSFRLPHFLRASYGGAPNPNMVVVAMTDGNAASQGTNVNNLPYPNCYLGSYEYFNKDQGGWGFGNPQPCVVWIEAKGTISLGPYDTLFIAHDGGVMLRASQGDPVADPGAWVAPFRATVAGGIVCETARFGAPTGSYNVDLLYQATLDGVNNVPPPTPAVLALMVVPQGSPIPACQ